MSNENKNLKLKLETEIFSLTQQSLLNVEELKNDCQNKANLVESLTIELITKNEKIDQTLFDINELNNDFNQDLNNDLNHKISPIHVSQILL